MNIYVGNLSYEVKEEDLKSACAAFGKVTSAKVISDTYSGQSKGFGFVEMESREAGEQVIAQLNGTDLKGRAIVVNEARPKTDRPGGGSGGGFKRNGGGGGRREQSRW